MMNLVAIATIHKLHPKIMKIIAYSNAAIFVLGLGLTILIFGIEATMLHLIFCIAAVYLLFYIVFCAAFYVAIMADSQKPM